MRGYQTLQHNYYREYEDMSFEEYVEKMALLGSFVTRIQDEQEGTVLFENVGGEHTLIDDKIIEILQTLPGDLGILPPQES